MKIVDPKELFARIAKDIPGVLHEHVFVVGSLAAARHFADDLEGQGVKTKDADLVVHPAGDAQSAQSLAARLLELGWRRRDDCYPQNAPDPRDELRAIRLYPPEHDDYYVEFLNVPPSDQKASKEWIPVRLDDGWYGVPSFEFLGLTAYDRERSDSGIEYASPCMMALANLLSHPTVGTDRMSTPIGGKDILRSAKDLGRVLALARLTGREDTERWRERWRSCLEQCFPDRWKELARQVGKGLRELLHDDEAFGEAWLACDVGLLNGKGVTKEQLRATARRLIVDAIEPFENVAKDD